MTEEKKDPQVELFKEVMGAEIKKELRGGADSKPTWACKVTLGIHEDGPCKCAPVEPPDLSKLTQQQPPTGVTYIKGEKPVSTREILDRLIAANPEALTADGFEDALIGMVEQFGRPTIALYDYDKCITILMTRDKMDESEAKEFFEFNVIGAWMGDNTPAFATIMRKVS